MHTRLPSALRTLSLALIAVASTAHADTITVCLDGSCDFTDPAAAVNAAVTGDIVEIAAGTYPLGASLSVYGQNITIRGAVDAKGRPATVLDGQGARIVLTMTSIIGQPNFENLVFANGRSDYGGGVFASGSSPVFRNCHFRNNVANWRGGALFNQNSSATLIDCELIGNTGGSTQFPSNSSAGAVSVGTGTTTLIGCTVRQNSTPGVGGAFALASSSTLVLESTRVCGNSAPNGAQIQSNPGAVVTELPGTCISNDCADCPTSPACPADLNANGFVDGTDLGNLLAAWGPCADCLADIDGDGFVDGRDLGMMLGAWGACR